MFNYFNTIEINSSSVLDIWKSIDIDIDSDNYQTYKIIEGDNLMGISYKHYGNINDWWVIYLFNNMYNINFELLQPEVLEATVLKHRTDVINYDTITTKRQNYIRETIRNYYLISNDLIDSIKLTNRLLSDDSLKNDEEFLSLYSGYIEDTLIINSYYDTTLKIPNGKLLFQIKNEINSFAKVWK